MTELPNDHPLRAAVYQMMDVAFAEVEKSFNVMLAGFDPILAGCTGREEMVRALRVSLRLSNVDANVLANWLTLALVQRRELATELELIKMGKGES